MLINRNDLNLTSAIAQHVDVQMYPLTDYPKRGTCRSPAKTVSLKLNNSHSVVEVVSTSMTGRVPRFFVPHIDHTIACLGSFGN